MESTNENTQEASRITEEDIEVACGVAVEIMGPCGKMVEDCHNDSVWYDAYLNVPEYDALYGKIWWGDIDVADKDVLKVQQLAERLKVHHIDICWQDAGEPKTLSINSATTGA